MAVFDQRDFDGPQFDGQGAGSPLVTYAGAAVSLALIVGVSMWGYNLIMRDVSGVPVVRAMDGAMRVSPQNPGGDIAQHAGLSVNQVAGDGAAAAPSDSLLLAPTTEALAEEDLRVEPLAEADEVRPLERPTDLAVAEQPAVLTNPEDALNLPEGPLSTDDILALADQIAGGATPLGDLAAGEAVAPQVTVDGEAVATLEIIAASVPGVSQSPRPVVRPRVIQAAAAPAATAAPVAPIADVSDAVTAALTQAIVVNGDLIPTGTNLVQLGAYPSPDDAATAWTQISGQFAEYMGDKERVVLEATSGGRTFYRLRAMGFAEIGDARRFCATLAASNADCIPVVVR